MFAFPEVIEGKENVCVFSYGVVGKALEIDKQVMRDRNPTRITMTLPHTVTLKKKDKGIRFKTLLFVTYTVIKLTTCSECTLNVPKSLQIQKEININFENLKRAKFK